MSEQQSNCAIEEKLCRKCGIVKPVELFAKSKRYPSGIKNMCLACHAAYNKAYVAANRERAREWHRRSSSTPRAKKQISDYFCSYYKKHKDRRLAVAAVSYAIKRGELVRPNKCERCGAECFTEGSHDDYSKPLSVEWLCRCCHRAKDAILRKMGLL